MAECVSISEVRDFIEERQESGPIVGGCRSQSNRVYNWLREHGISDDEIEVVQSYFNGDYGVAEHFYVKVQLDGDWLILDPTVHQFTVENYEVFKSDTAVPDEEIPSVGVITPSDSLYHRYE